MINDSTLNAILEEQINNSIGGYSSDLENDQALSMDYYFGRPFGDEQDGLSTVVTRDVLETIEWIMPSMMRVFASGERTVQFDPTGEEDEEQAEQETDYINYVFNKENDGYMILYNWIKSSLLLKNAYVKIWVEEEETIKTETYEGLSEAQLLEVFEQDGVEVIEQDSYFETVIQQDPITMQPIEGQIEVFDIKIEVTTTEKKVKIACLPNEEVRVARATNSLSVKDSPFFSHSRPMTQSELIGMGFDKKKVKMLPGYDGEKDGELEIAREQLNDEDSTQYEEADDSMRLITVDECYIRMDMEENGRAQLWKVLRAGNEILDKEPIDFIPIATLSPIPMPHQHIGLAESDLVMDLQRIRSVLMRQILDNLYLSNNPEKEVLFNKVNMDDLLTSRAGGIKRVTQMGSINPLTVPFTAGSSMPMLDLLDQMKETRTGIGKGQMGLDADTLAKSTKGAFMGAMEQANQRLEMLARTFAETGIKEAFLMIHELVIKHYDRSIPVKLNNKFVEVSPIEWKDRTNMTVVVGLGTGNRDSEISQLWTMAEKQENHLMQGSPLVTPKNLYNTLARLTERSDMKNVALYWTDPDSEEAQQAAQQKAQQQPQQSPEQVIAQAEMQMNQDRLLMDNKELEHKTMMEIEELEIRKRELALEEYKAGMQGSIEAAKIEADRYEADTKAETQLAVEQVKAGASVQEVLNSVLSAQQQQNDDNLTAAINGILGELDKVRIESIESLEGMNTGFNEQLQTLAGQMNRPKRVIYAEDGETPIGVEPVME